MANNKLKNFFSILLLIILGISRTVSGQDDWNFIKEKDGIRIYTRNSEDNPVKSFKGETVLFTTMEKISLVIGSIESFEWWADNISEIKVLDYQKEKLIKYYLVYDVPWPLDDRDLCVEAIISHDSITGIRTVYATPLLGVIPEKPGKIRIKNYWQKWEMVPVGPDRIRLILEGSVDPGGAIPSWIVNMVISDTPLDIMRKVKEQVNN